jgi:hypothetical protein
MPPKVQPIALRVELQDIEPLIWRRIIVPNGDGWRHRLVVEAVPVAWSGNDLPLPTCSAGENACPPEDVGGPPGYEHFLSVIGDPNGEEFKDTLRWIGGPFDLKGFDRNRINREWRGAARRRSR